MSSIMHRIVAGLAKSLPVGDVITKLNVISPWLYMVRLQAITSLVANLAREIVLFKDELMPLFVFVSTDFSLAASLVAFIARMSCSALEMGGAAPFWRGGAASYSFKQVRALFWIIPTGDDDLACLLRFLGRGIVAVLGTKAGISALRRSKRDATISTNYEVRRMKACPRAILSVALLQSAWDGAEGFSAPLT